VNEERFHGGCTHTDDDDGAGRRGAGSHFGSVLPNHRGAGDLAKSFGKGTGFALGLIFLSVIFILILGFGDVRYVGPAAAPGGMGAPGGGMGTPPPPPMPS
jgi:hypothetical protein